jgi:hypothetical protein
MTMTQDSQVIVSAAEVVNTSADAFEQLGLKVRQRTMRQVLEAAVRLHKTGQPDVTRAEIQEEMERLLGRQKDGSVSGRVNELVAAQSLLLVGTRVNPETGMPCKTYVVPAKQLRLCA